MRSAKLLAFFSAVLIAIVAVADTDNAYFDGHLLTIPAVDTPDKAGTFQDVVLEYSEDDGWQLVDFRRGYEIGLIDAVTVIVNDDTFPVQVFLNVSGSFSNGCGAVGDISFRISDNRIETFMYYKPVPKDILCTQAVVPFQEFIPLPVYGLPRGTYEYVLNGEFRGSFTLDEDNEMTTFRGRVEVE